VASKVARPSARGLSALAIVQQKSGAHDHVRAPRSIRPYGLRTLKKTGVLPTRIGADGLAVPTSVHEAGFVSVLVFWRTNPGPLLQETTT